MRRFASTVVIAVAFLTAQLSQQTQRKRVGQWLLRAHLLPAHLLSVAHRGWGPGQRAWGQQAEKCFLFLEQKTRCFLMKISQ